MSTFDLKEPRPGVLSLSGEMTIDNACEIRERLLHALGQYDKIDVDLLNVTKFDTAGVQLLVLLHREAKANNKQLCWLGYSLAVSEVLELLDLTKLLGPPAAVMWS